MHTLPLLVLFILLAGCSDDSATKVNYSTDGEPAFGDVFVDATIGEASNLVPFLGSDSGSHAVASQIYNSLLRYDKDLNLEGELAERWEVSDDGLTLTFHLRRDVKWDDGKPLTSHDVLTTFNTIIDPNTLTAYAGDYEMVETATAPDPYTFRVTYAEPFAPALSSWAGLSILPAHIIEAESNINESRLITKPMGTGPYRLKNWDRGKDIILEANRDYFEHSPWIAQTRTRLIPDSDTQFLELKSGRIDSMSLTPLQFTRLTDKPDFTARYAKYRYLGSGYVYMGFKLDHPLFQDTRVRQALSYATPRDDIIKGVLMGQGQTLCCPFKPGTWAYNDQLTPYPHNPEKAKALLAKAGWTDSDDDGVLDKDGRPFTFTVTTNQGNAQRIRTAEILQQAFRDVGVQMEIRTQEWSTFIADTINARQFEAIILGWNLTPEPDPYDIWHSSKTGPREFNVVGFANDEADAMMETARRTFDQAERKAALDRFQEIIHTEQPYLFLYAPYALVAVHKRFKGIEPAPAGISHNFIDWYVPEAQQKYEVMAP